MKLLLMMLLAATSVLAQSPDTCPQPQGNKIRLCWTNPTTRANGTRLPREQLGVIRFYVNDTYLIRAVGPVIDRQWMEVTLGCYEPGRMITARAVDTTGLISVPSQPLILGPKSRTVCKK